MSVLFHFSLSISNYEYRRRLTVAARQQSLPQTSSDTESLIQNQSADEPSPSSSNHEHEPVLIAAPKKNFFR
jgi:hypothetical protein